MLTRHLIHYFYFLICHIDSSSTLSTKILLFLFEFLSEFFFILFHLTLNVGNLSVELVNFKIFFGVPLYCLISLILELLYFLILFEMVLFKVLDDALQYPGFRLHKLAFHSK
jgi:hypothetical protein